MKALAAKHFMKIDGIEKNISDGQRTIKKLANALNLNQRDVLDLSHKYLRQIEESKKLKGKSIDTKAALIIYVTSKKTNKPKYLKDVLKYVPSSEKEIKKCYKKCIEFFKGARLNAKDIIDKVAVKMNLSADIQVAAKATAENFVNKAFFEGKRP